MEAYRRVPPLAGKLAWAFLLIAGGCGGRGGTIADGGQTPDERPGSVDASKAFPVVQGNCPTATLPASGWSPLAGLAPDGFRQLATDPARPGSLLAFSNFPDRIWELREGNTRWCSWAAPGAVVWLKPAWQSTVLYAGVGDTASQIVFRSDDGGGWTRTGDTKVSGPIAIDPKDPDRLYAPAVDQRDLLLSEDGGRTWKGRPNGRAQVIRWAVTVPAHEGMAYVGGTVSGQAGLFRVTEAGTTWELLSPPASDAEGNQFAADGAGNLYHCAPRCHLDGTTCSDTDRALPSACAQSRDRGKTWVRGCRYTPLVRWSLRRSPLGGAHRPLV